MVLLVPQLGITGLGPGRGAKKIDISIAAKSVVFGSPRILFSRSPENLSQFPDILQFFKLIDE